MHLAAKMNEPLAALHFMTLAWQSELEVSAKYLAGLRPISQR